MENKPQVRIINYQPSHKNAFRDLNQAWIEKYFKMEKTDHDSLDNPQEYILDKGGFILVAVIEEEVVGVCALIKMNHTKYEFELAKMAVSPNHHKKGIAWKISQSIINLANEQGAKYLYLESNTKLTPAITLYRKLGFVEVNDEPSPYERANIQMELLL